MRFPFGFRFPLPRQMLGQFGKCFPRVGIHARPSRRVVPDNDLRAPPQALFFSSDWSEKKANGSIAHSDGLPELPRSFTPELVSAVLISENRGVVM
jgi:hypothetical protein